MKRKLIKATETAIIELQNKYKDFKILLYYNVKRNDYELIIDVEKYGLDDEFGSGLKKILGKELYSKGLDIYTYFIDDFDEKKKKQESMMIRLKIWAFFRPVIALFWPLRDKIFFWVNSWEEY